MRKEIGYVKIYDPNELWHVLDSAPVSLSFNISRFKATQMFPSRRNESWGARAIYWSISSGCTSYLKLFSILMNLLSLRPRSRHRVMNVRLDLLWLRVFHAFLLAVQSICIVKTWSIVEDIDKSFQVSWVFRSELFVQSISSVLRFSSKFILIAWKIVQIDLTAKRSAVIATLKLLQSTQAFKSSIKMKRN